MLAGQVQGVGGFYDHNIALQAQGKSSEAVVSMLQIPGEVELCRSDLKGTITSPADFKGTVTRHHRHRLVDRLPDAVPHARRPAWTRRRRPAAAVGAGQTFIAAMKQKAIDCGMTTEPTVSQAVSDGTAFILLDMRTAEGSKKALGGTYPATSLYMQTDWVGKNKATVQKLVNALRLDAGVDPGAQRGGDRRQDAGRLLQGRRQGARTSRRSTARRASSTRRV